MGKIIIAHAGGIGLAAEIAELLANIDYDAAEAEPIARAIEMRPSEDFIVPTAKELWLAGGRSRGTKRTDIPRPRDLYRQRKRGGRP